MFCARCGFIALLCLVGCSEIGDKKFRLIPSSESGIKFKNILSPSVDFNILNYIYFYNGGGAAVGDLNGDDLTDIYFTANQESNKLYLNEGNLKFKDITEQAGVEGFKGWDTGVTLADVNNDGRLDIYVSFLGDYLLFKGKNQLFINEGNDEHGIPRFADRAMEFGLDLVGFSTQAAFFDYDRDGDLDMFMLTHSLHQQGTFGKSTLRAQHHPQAGDKLLRNDNGFFIDVTSESGIFSSVLGYGLGVVVSDVNLDGWPDLYVGNDFHENDYLYINQGNGTFIEKLEKCMRHTSRFTMGVDFADFNNDAFPDLISMDMLPEDPIILRSSAAEDPYDVYNFKLNFGYHHQFARNVLQLNNQDETFSDIALQAGVAATDWSWSTLWADFDLDGCKDILVSNGILRRPNDLDYINFVSADTIQTNLEKLDDRELSYIKKMPQVKLSNLLFVNKGDSTFKNRAKEWGLEQSSYSNGAVYADLDNDGDLDIVMNNVEEEAFLYENRTINKNENPVSHYLQFSFKGKPGNLFGIGTKVFVYDSGDLQMQECMPTRGFQSAVDHRLTFGLGSSTGVDSVVVVWNDGTFQALKKVKGDQRIRVEQQNASGNFEYSHFHATIPWFKNASEEIVIPFKHKENNFVEFNREQLIPHMMSAEGPASAVGDVNGDGRDDIFIGGGKLQQGKMFIQNANGKFINLPQTQIDADSMYEDVSAIFFDADKDKDIDLFVVSGGNEFSGKSKYRNPRLYFNDGKGFFLRSTQFQDIFHTGSCASAEDFDQDGDIDLFLGTRAIPWRYGIKPDSYILINDGSGNFFDTTDNVAPSLREFGFVKNSSWADIDGDKKKDLIIAAEWSPITILLNRNGKLLPLGLEGSGFEKSNGWWNVIEAADFDKDGDLDLIAGNLGLNSKLHASVDKPIKMYVADFDHNDSTDQILTHLVNDVEYPFHTRDEMTKQMPFLKKEYLSYRKFAETPLNEMFSNDLLEKANQYMAYRFESVYIENLGGNKFNVKALPKAAQFSTVNAISIDDFNQDGNLDVMLAGNFYHANIQMGRYDASYGLLLKGNGRGSFEALSNVKSGFSVKGQVRNLEKINVVNRTFYLAVRNNDTVEAFTLDK
jgi:enediyne biosynthesis protein E4